MEERIINKTKQKREYNKEHYKRIEIQIPKEMYANMQSHVEQMEETISGFIKRAIEETIENDSRYW